MSEERQFFENLLGQRFNFFLIFVGLIAAGYITSKQQVVQLILLVVGAVVSFMLTMTLERAQVKLKIIMDTLYGDPCHPAAIVNRKANAVGGWMGRRSRNALIGRDIPRFFTGALIAATVGHVVYMWLD